MMFSRFPGHIQHCFSPHLQAVLLCEWVTGLIIQAVSLLSPSPSYFYYRNCSIWGHFSCFCTKSLVVPLLVT